MSINAFLARGFNPGAGQLEAEKAQYTMDRDSSIRSRNAMVQDRNYALAQDSHALAADRHNYMKSQNASNASAAQEQAEAEHARWVMGEVQKAQTPEQARSIYEWGMNDAQKRGFDTSDAPTWEQIQGTFVPPAEKPQSYGNTFTEVELPDGSIGYAQPGGPDGYRVLDGIAPPGPSVRELAEERKAEAQANEAELSVEEAENEKAAIQRGKQEGADLAESLLEDPAFGSVYGSLQGMTYSVRPDVVDAEAKVDQLVNMLTLENTKKMTGVLSESDIKILASAGTTLANKRISDEAAKAELEKVAEVFKRASQPDYDPGGVDKPPVPGAELMVDANGNRAWVKDGKVVKEL